jgi:hypothetical protein
MRKNLFLKIMNVRLIVKLIINKVTVRYLIEGFAPKAIFVKISVLTLQPKIVNKILKNYRPKNQN